MLSQREAYEEKMITDSIEKDERIECGEVCQTVIFVCLVLIFLVSSITAILLLIS